MDILIAAALAVAAFVYAAVPDAGANKAAEPMEESQPADGADVMPAGDR